MRAARAVIGGTSRLEHASLRGLFGELGTRARQSGVPFHAVVAEDALDPFGKRILDLQRVRTATDAAALAAAAEALGRDLATGAA